LSNTNTKFQRETILKGLVDILMPSVGGIVLYISVFLLTVIVRSAKSLQQYLYIPNGLNVKGGVLNFLNNSITSLFGIQRANVVVLSIFWGMVGIIVYVLLAGLMAVFAGFDKDLEERKYIVFAHKNYDHNEPLKRDIRRIGFRFAIGICLLYYVTHVLAYFLNTKFAGMNQGNLTFSIYKVRSLAVLFLAECLALHGVVILLRLLILRRRIFN